MSMTLVPGQEPVAAVGGDGIERWVFTQITKGRGYEIDFECEIHPLNSATFQAHVLPSMVAEQANKLPTLERYLEAYRDRTHIKLRRGKGSEEWSVEMVGTQESCRPRSQTARQVTEFGEPLLAEARDQGSGVSEESTATEDTTEIRRQRVTDPELESLGWVLALYADGWHALNTIRKHRGRGCHSTPAQAEEAAANLQDAFDRKVLSERDSAQSGWVDVEADGESGQGSGVGGQSEAVAVDPVDLAEVVEPVLSDAEAAEILEEAIDANGDPEDYVSRSLEEAFQERVNRALIAALPALRASTGEGLSDDELFQEVVREFAGNWKWSFAAEMPHAVCDTGGMKYVIACPDGEPAIWIDTTGPFGDPELSGIYLVNRVRELLNIRRPAEPVQTLHSDEDTAKPLPTGEIYLPVDRVFPSPMNPRKHFDEEYIAGLAESIKESGLINAIVVRVKSEPSEWIKIQPSLPGGPEFFDVVDTWDGVVLLGRYDTEVAAWLGMFEYEIVAGECRWRAHGKAELPSVRARIVEISDAEMRIVQLEENIKRKDLTPIEEAQAFADAISSGEFTIKTLAKRASVSESQIRGMMKLLSLPETARLALDMGGLSVSTAELIARRPNEQQRERLARNVIAEGLSYAQVKQLISEEYSRELKGALFELEDAELLPAAGACTTCPYRSGNDRETYPDGRDDVCNNPMCYSAKEAVVSSRVSVVSEEPGRHDSEIDSATEGESSDAAKTWDTAFSDGSKTFAPDQPNEQPAEVEADEDEDEANGSIEIPDYAVAEQIESQPEQAAVAESTTTKAKPAPAASSPSLRAGGFPEHLAGVPIHISVAIYPSSESRPARSTVIGVRQDAAQMGGKFVVVNATTLREVVAEVEKAVTEFIPSAKPIARRPSSDGPVKRQPAPAKPAAKAKSPKPAPAKPAGANKATPKKAVPGGNVIAGAKNSKPAKSAASSILAAAAATLGRSVDPKSKAKGKK